MIDFYHIIINKKKSNSEVFRGCLNTPVVTEINILCYKKHRQLFDKSILLKSADTYRRCQLIDTLLSENNYICVFITVRPTVRLSEHPHSWPSIATYLPAWTVASVLRRQDIEAPPSGSVIRRQYIDEVIFSCKIVVEKNRILGRFLQSGW